MNKLVKEAHWEGATTETAGVRPAGPEGWKCQNGGSVATKLVPTVVSDAENEHVRRA